MYGFNLSTHTYTSNTVKIVIYLSLFSVTAFFSIYNYFSYQAVNHSLDQSKIEINKLNSEVASLNKEMKEKIGHINLSDSKEMKKLSDKIDFVNSIIYENNFSWSELFFSLEKASPGDVSITSIKPSYASMKITLLGLAKHSKDIAAFVENLEGTSFIKKSYLLGESEELVDRKYRALSFQIEAEGNF